MKIFGGEQESPSSDLFFYQTDLGRSSLRLILRSLKLKGRIFIPDFLCPTVTDVLDQEKVCYAFYHIRPDLTIALSSLTGVRRGDAVYVIDYFGRRDNILDHWPFGKETLVIEDAVFSPWIEKPKWLARWIGFNSFRKILPVADGSFIFSTLKLNGQYLQPGEAPYVSIKYQAKAKKYGYVRHGLLSEFVYLNQFAQADRMIKRQKNIYETSAESLRRICDFFQNSREEQALRQKNYQLLQSKLSRYAVLRSCPSFASFFVMATPRRDALREFLFQKKVFLPVHWGCSSCDRNPLSERVLSIPVDGRYGPADMARVASLILRFLTSGKD